MLTSSLSLASVLVLIWSYQGLVHHHSLFLITSSAFDQPETNIAIIIIKIRVIISGWKIFISTVFIIFIVTIAIQLEVWAL